jgi:hypothetical protein
VVYGVLNSVTFVMWPVVSYNWTERDILTTVWKDATTRWARVRVNTSSIYESTSSYSLACLEVVFGLSRGSILAYARRYHGIG